MTSPLKILIADDSVIYRSHLRAALSGIADIEVVGFAANGRLAVEKLKQTPTDLLILDLEMPELNGLETLTEIKNLQMPVKVILFSAFSKKGAEITLEALKRGASDFVTKPGAESGASVASGQIQPVQLIRDLIEPKIRGLFSERFGQQTNILQVRSSMYGPILWDLFCPKIVVFGSSTGGPTVLETIFSGLCGPLSCPILIAQHMPPIFTAALAERLSKLSGIPAKEASHKEIVKPNTIYIAPGDYHLTVQGTAENCELHLDQKEKENFVRPAVDPLFRSAAHIYRDRCLGLVLTGMGSDGRNGAQAIKEAGGAVIIQDRKSSVVFGMPGAVEQAQAFDKMISPQEMIHLLREKICPFSTHGGYSFAKN